MSGHRQRWEWDSLYCKVWCIYWFLLNLCLCLFFAWCRKWRPEGWNAEEVWAFSASCWALPRLSLYSALHGENTLLLSKPIFHMQNRQKWEEAYRLAVRLKAPGNSTFYITTSNTFMFLICFFVFLAWSILTAPLHFCPLSNQLLLSNFFRPLWVWQEFCKFWLSKDYVNPKKKRLRVQEKLIYAERMLDKVDKRGLRVLRSAPLKLNLISLNYSETIIRVFG